MARAQRLCPMIAILLVVPLSGCGFEMPERPIITTTFHVPLETEHLTAGDLAGGMSTIESWRESEVDADSECAPPERLTLDRAWSHGAPFEVRLDGEVRERLERGLERIVVRAEIENSFPTDVRLKVHFARTEASLFTGGGLTFGGETARAALVDPQSGCVEHPVRSEILLTCSAGDLGLFAEPEVLGGLEVILVNENGGPIDLWNTDYVTVNGIVAIECRLE